MGMSGFADLQKELQSLQRLGDDLDGEIGIVTYNAGDPESIERAIAEVEQLIDAKVGNNPGKLVAELVEEIKASYRESILDQAAQARLSNGGDDVD